MCSPAPLQLLPPLPAAACVPPPPPPRKSPAAGGSSREGWLEACRSARILRNRGPLAATPTPLHPCAPARGQRAAPAPRARCAAASPPLRWAVPAAAAGGGQAGASTGQAHLQKRGLRLPAAPGCSVEAAQAGGQGGLRAAFAASGSKQGCSLHRTCSQCQPPRPTALRTTARWPMREAFVRALPRMTTICRGTAHLK